MTKRATEITSSSHAMAIALYLMMTLLGVLSIIGSNIAPSLYSMIGDAGIGLWSLILTFSGVICAAVCLLPHRGSPSRISRSLIVEFWSALVLALTAGLYGYAILYSLIHSEEAKGQTTLVFVCTVIFGCLGRDTQIWFDLRRVRKARLSDTTIQVAAEPEDR